MAHLRTQATRGDNESRRREKLRLVRDLYEHGWTRERVRRVFRLIEWIMKLPDELNHEIHREIRRIEEEKQMPYVTSIERFAKEEGIVEDAQDAVLDVLDERFGRVPPETASAVRALRSAQRLRELRRAAVRTPSLADFAGSLGS